MKAISSTTKFSISTPSKRNFGLDLVRMVAILVVVIGHGQGFLLDYAVLPGFWKLDGVDIFFVLSGFLIGGILIKQVNAPGFNFSGVIYFWKRRWFRTLPAYYFVLLLSIAFGVFHLCTFTGFEFLYFIFSQNLVTPHPDFFAVAWSLAVEEWGYILLPLSFLAIFFFSRRLADNKRFLKWSLFTVLTLLILVPLAYRLKTGIYFSQGLSEEIWDILFRKRVITRLDSIFVGVLGAWFFVYYNKTWVKWRFIFLICGLAYLYLLYSISLSSYFHYSLFFSANSFCILLLFPFFTSLKTAPAIFSAPVGFISKISYSMYLIHLQLIIEPIMQLRGQGHQKSTGVFLLYLLITIVGSFILYRLIERPFMAMRK